MRMFYMYPYSVLFNTHRMKLVVDVKYQTQNVLKRRNLQKPVSEDSNTGLLSAPLV